MLSSREFRRAAKLDKERLALVKRQDASKNRLAGRVGFHRLDWSRGQQEHHCGLAAIDINTAGLAECTVNRCGDLLRGRLRVELLLPTFDVTPQRARRGDDPDREKP